LVGSVVVVVEGRGPGEKDDLDLRLLDSSDEVEVLLGRMGMVVEEDEAGSIDASKQASVVEEEVSPPPPAAVAAPPPFPFWLSSFALVLGGP